MKQLRVDVWSDIACPWCYVGKRRLEAALARFPHKSAVSVVWRAFELDASAPKQVDASMSQAERIAEKYGTSTSQAQAMIDRMVGVAKADGLEFRFDTIRSGNTFDAHRLLHLPEAEGVQDALKERLFHAYFSEGESMSDPATLARLASEVGLSEEGVRESLAGEGGAREVRADEREARELGITGVPFFVIGGRYAVSGAQPADVLLGALTQAWNELEVEPGPLAEGAACGPEGCA